MSLRAFGNAEKRHVYYSRATYSAIRRFHASTKVGLIAYRHAHRDARDLEPVPQFGNVGLEVCFGHPDHASTVATGAPFRGEKGPSHECQRQGSLAPMTEVMVNGPDDVYVERGGRIERAPDGLFEGEESVRHLIERIVGPLGLRFDESSPWADCANPKGSRVRAEDAAGSRNGGREKSKPCFRPLETRVSPLRQRRLRPDHRSWPRTPSSSRGGRASLGLAARGWTRNPS